jgi:uncharacterized integral membrane protein
LVIGRRRQVERQMIKRILTIVVLVPVAIVLIALAVANRTFVPFTLNPFDPGDPGLTLSLPLFVFLFIALLVGVLIGSAATWLRQGRYRKMARRHAEEARTLRDEAVQARPPAIRPSLSEPAN